MACRPMSLNPNLACKCPPLNYGDRTAQELQQSNYMSKLNQSFQLSTLKHVKDRQKKRKEGGWSQAESPAGALWCVRERGAELGVGAKGYGGRKKGGKLGEDAGGWGRCEGRGGRVGPAVLTAGAAGPPLRLRVSGGRGAEGGGAGSRSRCAPARLPPPPLAAVPV